jgi:hypothetical protein
MIRCHGKKYEAMTKLLKLCQILQHEFTPALPAEMCLLAGHCQKCNLGMGFIRLVPHGVEFAAKL